MDKCIYEIWCNNNAKLRYTILSDGGLVWVCNDGSEPIFIGLLGSHEEQLGKMFSHEY